MAVDANQLLTAGEGVSCSPDIAIHVKNGTAIISGTACSNAQIVQAEDAVNVMPGIDRVFNLVKTKRD